MCFYRASSKNLQNIVINIIIINTTRHESKCMVSNVIYDDFKFLKQQETFIMKKPTWTRQLHLTYNLTIHSSNISEFLH